MAIIHCYSPSSMLGAKPIPFPEGWEKMTKEQRDAWWCFVYRQPLLKVSNES